MRKICVGDSPLILALAESKWVLLEQMVEVAQSHPIRQWLFKQALASKKAELKQGIIRNNSFWDFVVFHKVC